MKDKNVELQKLIVEQARINKKITVSLEVITPDVARSYLQQNILDETVKNRIINKNTVKAYVKDILADRWKVGAPIIFDDKETMIDGQTRCTSVVTADKAILSLVIRGVGSDIFDVLDSGKKRTHKDALTSLIFNGKVLKRPSSVSAGINLMYSVNRNHKNIDKNRGFLTNSEIVEIVRSDFDYYNIPFEENLILNWRKNINNAVPENTLVGFYYINKKNYNDLNGFLDIITSNDANTPTIVREFRDMILENKGKRSDERNYLSSKAIYLLINALFGYHKNSTGLNGRKHFSKTDLDIINE